MSCKPPSFNSVASINRIKDQINKRPRFKIERNAKSHATITQQSSSTTPTFSSSSSSLPGTAPPIKSNPKKANSADEQQMLGHLAHPQELTGVDTVVLPRSSAVLLPLCLHDNVPSILFIKRTSKRGSHRGQLSFPGGIFDAEDKNDPIKCALREMNEEIGLQPSDFEIIGLHHDAGTSDSSQDKDNLKVLKSTIITPVVAMLKEDLTTFLPPKVSQLKKIGMKLSINELDYVFTIPLTDLCKLESGWTNYRSRPAFNYQHTNLNKIILPLHHGPTQPFDRTMPPVTIDAGFGGIDGDGKGEVGYHLAGKEEFESWVKQTQTQDRPTIQKALPLSSSSGQSPRFMGDVDISQPISIKQMDNLTLGQLQNLSVLEQRGEIVILNEHQEESNLTPTAQSNTTTHKPIVYIPTNELLWGATAHMTNLFLKQVMIPLDSLSTPQQ